MATPPMSGRDEVISEQGPVAIVRSTGTVDDLHRSDPFTLDPIVSLFDSGVGLIVRSCSATDSAVVLGSRQDPNIIDDGALADAGLGLVKRRSGGGAVLVTPGDPVWIDLVAAPGWFPDDVHGSMVVAGRLWNRALLDSGVGDGIDRKFTLYEGRLEAGEWAELVCFAGRGPGEVFVGDRKLVGLSQRRTRHGVRISGALYRSDLVPATVAVLAPPLPVGAPIGAATTAEVGLGDLAEHDLIAAIAGCARDRHF